jgi:hypothetical protein
MELHVSGAREGVADLHVAARLIGPLGPDMVRLLLAPVSRPGVASVG